MQIFNTGDFRKVVQQIDSEAISKIRYPTEALEAWDALQLVQKYFLVACSQLADLRECDRCHHPVKMATIGSGIVLALGLSVGIPVRAAGAALDLDDEVWVGISSSFYTPLGQLLDGSAEESLSARYALDIPMKSYPIAAVGYGLQGEPASSPTLQFGLKYVPLTSWFASITFLKYLRSDLQKPWNPDFTYVFGYDDWHPYTFSAQYANYGGNRLNPNTARGEKRTNFMAGSWSVSYKFPLPQALESLVLISSDHAMGCTAGASLTPRYSDAATNKVLDNKRTLALGCKYAFGNNWYFNFALPYYLVKKQQQPWDPDFTYGFGYFDWHPGTWSIQYNNYSGTRFPWHPNSPRTGRFKDGSISISYGANWL